MEAIADGPFLLLLREGTGLYPEDAFEHRIGEEMLRHERSGNGFAFLEFQAENIARLVHTGTDYAKVWNVIWDSLHKGGRGSDAVGIVRGGKGLGVLIPGDTSGEAPRRLRKVVFGTLMDRMFVRPCTTEEQELAAPSLFYPKEFSQAAP